MESRKIRIGEAAAAIGTTPKSLRHWISRYANKGVKPTAEQTGTWLEFSWGDVAALAVARYLVDFGMPAPAAFAHAMAIVEKRWPGLFDVSDPHWSLAASTATVDFYFGRSSHFSGYDTWGTSSLEGESISSRFERGLERVGDKQFPARAIVTLHLSHIIFDALKALAEMGHAPPRLDDKETEQ